MIANNVNGRTGRVFSDMDSSMIKGIGEQGRSLVVQPLTSIPANASFIGLDDPEFVAIKAVRSLTLPMVLLVCNT